MIKKICLTITLLGACSYAVADVTDTGYIGAAFGSVDYSGDSFSKFDSPAGFELMLGKEIGECVQVGHGLGGCKGGRHGVSALR